MCIPLFSAFLLTVLWLHIAAVTKRDKNGGCFFSLSARPQNVLLYEEGTAKDVWKLFLRP